MSVYKRGPRWVAQVSEHGTKIHLGTFATQREAKAAVAAREAAKPSTSMTIAAWRERWLQTPTWKESTRTTNRERTHAFAETYGKRRMSDFTRAQARAWVRDHPTHHGGLSAMFGAAVYDDILTGNVFYKLVKRTTSRRALRPEWLTEQDVVGLEQAAYQAHGPIFGATVAGMIRFAAETGIRPGELFALRDGDLDPANGALYIRRQADSKNKIITTPKNGEEREVVLSKRATAAAALAIRQPGEERIFSTVRGHQFWANSWTWVWKPVKAVAGRLDMDFYELRHLCATRLLEAGMSEADVAVQLGHEDGGELVRRVYGHPSHRQARDRLRETMNRKDGAA
jgi:integrase